MLAYLFVVLALVFRFLPHPLSFTPVGASLLFFGARAPRKHAWIPVLLLAGSDVVLTRMVYGYPFTADQFATWAWYAAVIGLGTLLRDNARPLRLLVASLATAVSFFVLSNFAVWAVWSMYPKNMGGLAACYVAGLPFFRNEVVADMLFTAVMFGIAAALAARKPAGASRPA